MLHKGPLRALRTRQIYGKDTKSLYFNATYHRTILFEDFIARCTQFMEVSDSKWRDAYFEKGTYDMISFMEVHCSSFASSVLFAALWGTEDGECTSLIRYHITSICCTLCAVQWFTFKFDDIYMFIIVWNHTKSPRQLKHEHHMIANPSLMQICFDDFMSFLVEMLW